MRRANGSTAWRGWESIRWIAWGNYRRGILAIHCRSLPKSRMRWRPKPAATKPSSTSAAAADGSFEHIQAFFDETHGQITIGEIPPIRRAALAAVAKNAPVALVCGEPENLPHFLPPLTAALSTPP